MGWGDRTWRGRREVGVMGEGMMKGKKECTNPTLNQSCTWCDNVH